MALSSAFLGQLVLNWCSVVEHQLPYGRIGVHVALYTPLRKLYRVGGMSSDITRVFPIFLRGHVGAGCPQ